MTLLALSNEKDSFIGTTASAPIVAPAVFWYLRTPNTP
jgi:hypothetical protein